MSSPIPVITLIGENPVTVERGGNYIDAGATASDQSQGDISNQIVTKGLPINTNVVGTYIVTYNVTDSTGLKAQEVVRTVSVVDVKPVITLIGENILHIAAGQTYVDPGATAFDQFQGDISASIITTSNVNTDQPGTYKVTYNVKNQEGVTAQEVFRTVVVVDEATPTITVTGDNPATVEINKQYDDAGATAFDQFQGQLKVNPSGQVNTNVAGKYQVVYTATNEGGITSTATRDVYVLEAPTITLAGSNPMDIDVFQRLELPGAFGSDSYYGNLTNDIVIDTKHVNMNVPGTYDITYNLTNPAQMSAKEQIRTVRVMDPYVPEIILKGTNPYTLQTTTTPYIDPGATASDKVYGNLTNDIVVAGVENVDLIKPGVHEVTYNVTNPDGLTGTAVRTVSVIDTGRVEHIILESAGTHSVTLSDSFKNSGKAYLGLANPSQDPNFHYIDVTSRVIADMDDTTSFKLPNGDINSWYGADVAPGKQKALYIFDK